MRLDSQARDAVQMPHGRATLFDLPLAGNARNSGGVAACRPCQSAVGFALALNGLLVLRYFFHGSESFGWVSLTSWIGLIAWVAAVIREFRALPVLIVPRKVSDVPDRFPEAHACFVRGELGEAEQLLKRVLSIEPRDPPALLLLVGVYRLTDRLESARVLLLEVSRLEVAEDWNLEVQAERDRLDRALQRAEESRRDPEETSENQSEDAADLTGDLRNVA